MKLSDELRALADGSLGAHARGPTYRGDVERRAAAALDEQAAEIAALREKLKELLAIRQSNADDFDALHKFEACVEDAESRARAALAVDGCEVFRQTLLWIGRCATRDDFEKRWNTVQDIACEALVPGLPLNPLVVAALSKLSSLKVSP